MRIIKKILIAAVLLIAVVLIAALFTKKEYSVERQITINKPREEVFAYVKYLKNQDNFSKWASMDPAMKKEYRGTDGTVGFVSAWESEKDDVGKGEQEISNIADGSRIDSKLHFIEPFEGKADAYMVTEALPQNSTRVKWGFQSKMAYPMNIMLLFMDMEDMIGKDLETGLSNLKSQMENK
jgi:hypothetical protein